MASFNAPEFNAYDSEATDRDLADDDLVVVERGPAEDPAVADLTDLTEPDEPATASRPDIRVVPDDAGPGDDVPSAVIPAQETVTADLNGDDERWHDIVAGFIDDPRGSVAEAAELVEAEVTSLIALLSRRRDSLGETWQNDRASETSSGATEDLRLAIRSYRDFSRQVTASVKALG